MCAHIGLTHAALQHLGDACVESQSLVDVLLYLACAMRVSRRCAIIWQLCRNLLRFGSYSYRYLAMLVARQRQSNIEGFRADPMWIGPVRVQCGLDPCWSNVCRILVGSMWIGSLHGPLHRNGAEVANGTMPLVFVGLCVSCFVSVVFVLNACRCLWLASYL